MHSRCATKLGAFGHLCPPFLVGVPTSSIVVKRKHSNFNTFLPFSVASEMCETIEYQYKKMGVILYLVHTQKINFWLSLDLNVKSK